MKQHASLNRSFRLVRRADAQVQPVPETARGHGGGRTRVAAAAGAAMVSLPMLGWAGPPAVTQLPQGGNVVAGQASLQSQAATLTVNQASQRAVIDWQSFNLGSQASVVFNQAAGRNAATLNRVLDSQPSQILGRIQAPGQVFISNPNGVIFGSSASVDVGGLIATSMSMGASDFMAGRTTWQRNGATGAVLNAGHLTAAEGGYIALLAPEVRNEGVIVARAGTVALAAGEAVRLEFNDAQFGSVQVSASELKTLVENRHAILAPGGYVLLAARSADALRSGVVNQAGVIDAGSVVSRGGRVLLVGDDITLAAGSRTGASGAAGGGEVLVGGDWQGSGGVHQATRVTMAAGASIDASATQQGDGGKVVLWSDVGSAASLTGVRGSIAARGGAQGGAGGRIETSGHAVDVAGASVDASAAKGPGGQWLIDPTDITINAASAATYASTLNAGTNVSVQTASTGGAPGDITVASSLAWSSDAALTLSAARHIVVNAPITATGANATLTLEYGQGAVASGNTANYSVYAPIDLRAGPNFITRLGSDGSPVTHTVITALGSAGSSNDGTLQGMGGALGGHFVLGADIDAAATSAWNGGQGFTPIGADTSNMFSGSLDGLGHIVSGLAINRPGTTYVGLFGVLDSSAIVRNVGLANAQVTGYGYVGTLAGESRGAISDSFASGSATAYEVVGGLIGNSISGSITNSYATVNVVGSADYAGGLSGNNGSAIENAYAIGNVTGSNYVGGLVGYQNANSGSSINHTYAYGTVTGSTNVDPHVGYRDAGATIINSAAFTHPNDFFYGVNLDGITGNPHWLIYEGLAAPLLSAFLRPLTVSMPTSTIYNGTLLADPSALTLSSPGATLLGLPVYVGSGLTPNVGTYGGVTGAGLYSAQQGWRISYAPVTLTIDRAALGVAGASAASRVYDRTTSASVSGGTLAGTVYGSDAVTLSAGTASFADANVGTGKAVTTAYTLTGAAANNYQLTQPVGLTASITPASVTLSGATTSSRAYNGSTAATVSGSLTGVLGGDSVTLSSTASFADANVGTGKAVSASFSLGGSSAGNYQLVGATPSGLQANITQLGSVSWIGGASGDWFSAANWAGGAVPTLANVAHVVIPTGVVATLSNVAPSNTPLLASLSGAGGVQLTQASLSASGAVNLGSVALGADGSLLAGSLSTASYTQTGGALAVGGALTVNGTFAQTGGLMRAGGAAQITQATGDLAVRHLVANGVTLAATQGDLRFTNLGSVGNATLSASGQITESAGGSLTVLGDASLNAGGNVSVDQARNMVVGSVSAHGQNVRLTQGLDDLALGNVSATGNLVLSAAAGNIRQADATAVSVTGTTSATAAQGSVYLMSADNHFTGAVSASAADIAITQGTSPLVLGDIAARSNLAIASGGAVTQTGSLTVAGRTSIDAAGNAVTLERTTNDFAGAVAVRSAALTLVDGVGGLSLGNVSTSGTTEVNSLDGAITQDRGVFSSSASQPANFNAWKDGVYTSVGLNTAATVLVNGQPLGAEATAAAVSRGVASAMSAVAPTTQGNEGSLQKTRRPVQTVKVSAD